MTEELFRRNDDVVAREVAGELFLVPIRGHLAELQQLLVLNDVASFLWGWLAEPQSVAALVAATVEEFEVDAEEADRDVRRFLTELAEAGLLHTVNCP